MKIFVVVGTQLNFNRMIKIIDEWAYKNRDISIFAQIGKNSWKPRNIEWIEFIGADDFTQKCKDADLIVAHAGMGTIITALQYNKPVLIFPRRADLGEQRNDHQLATTKYFIEMNYVNGAFTEDEFTEQLNKLSSIKAKKQINPYASGELLETIKDFINKNQ